MQILRVDSSHPLTVEVCGTRKVGVTREAATHNSSHCHCCCKAHAGPTPRNACFQPDVPATAAGTFKGHLLKEQMHTRHRASHTPSWTSAVSSPRLTWPVELSKVAKDVQMKPQQLPTTSSPPPRLMLFSQRRPRRAGSLLRRTIALQGA